MDVLAVTALALAAVATAAAGAGGVVLWRRLQRAGAQVQAQWSRVEPIVGDIRDDVAVLSTEVSAVSERAQQLRAPRR